MKIPLDRAYFVFWVREDGVDECLWGTLSDMWRYLGQFALNTDVTGVFTSVGEAQQEQRRQIAKRMKAVKNG